MCVKKTVRHRLLLAGNHTHYYSKPHPLNMPTKPRPSNTSNIGMPCGCGLIFNDIHIFFSFSLLPTYPICYHQVRPRNNILF